MQATTAPKQRTWLPTKLGATWSAAVNGTIMQHLRVRQAGDMSERFASAAT